MKQHALNRFWRQLATADQPLLLLDYDGTLAPFRIERDLAVPYPGVREQLNAIQTDTVTRLMIISGRAIDDLLPLLALDPLPEIWGCHGWERLDIRGQHHIAALPDQATIGLRQARLCLSQQNLGHGCETKPTSLAFHWRGCDPLKIDHLQRVVQDQWQPIAKKFGLEIHRFNGGLELRCPGKCKGTTLEAILAEDKTAAQPVAFLGDDLTDEDGFDAIKGRGLGILVNSDPRKTSAELQLTPPGELLEFLATWHRHVPRKPNHTQGNQP